MVPEQPITFKGMNLDTELIPVTKIKSKLITGLNVKHETIKLLEDNIEENLDDLEYGDDFLDTTSKAQCMKEIIDNKLDFVKTINLFCNVKRMAGNRLAENITGPPYSQVLHPQIQPNLDQKKASLVAQWLRVCLPMQGTRVRALVWEDPTCRGATRPVSHNY